MNEFGETLVPALLRTGLFLSVSVVVVFLLFRLFRVASPAVRRTACFVVLLQGWFFVQWSVEIPVLPMSDSEVTGERSQGFWKFLRSGGSLNSFVRTLSDINPDVSISKNPYSPAPDLLSATVPTSLSVTETAEKVSIRSGHVSWTVCLVFLWGAGILVISCRTLWMYVRFIRELPSELSAEPEWESEWKSLQRQSGLRAFIPLYVTEQTGPMLCRFPRGYRLIVPANFWRELSLSQRLSILRHELAHVQRRDVWKSLAIRVLALPHWFNPLAWWAVKQFDECAEWACDEAARKATPGHVSDYARALLRLGVNTDPISSLYPAARGRGLMLRVRRLLVSNNMEDSRMKKFSFVTLVLGISLFGVMRFQLVADEPEKATDADPSATKSDSTENKVRLPEEKTGRLLFGFGVNSDTGVLGRVVLNEDNFSTPASSKKAIAYETITSSDLLRGEDYDTENIVIRKKNGKNYYYVQKYASPRKEASSVPAFPGHEAVIDMAYIFKNFDEFKREREKLKTEIDGTQREKEKLVKDTRSLQVRLKKLVQGVNDETDLVVELLEREIERKRSEMEVNRVYSQKKYIRKEAQMYQRIYNKITAEVAKYAKARGIKIVRRIDWSAQRKIEIDASEASDPKEIMRRMNQEIVYIESNELDITEDILKRLQPKKKISSTKSVRN